MTKALLSVAIMSLSSHGNLIRGQAPPTQPTPEPKKAEMNWARSFNYSAAKLHVPISLDEVRDVVKQSKQVKILGSRHSFSNIADTKGDLISLENFNRLVVLDQKRMTVTVEGGIRYGPLCEYLHAKGYAIHNLASLPHISVAGAISTATHGSGDRNGNLATAVTELELITANGETKILSRENNPEEFCGAVVGLGGIGVITKVTLSIQPTFDVQQFVYVGTSLAALNDSFDWAMSQGYSVSIFTNWKDDALNQVWVKRRCIKDEQFVPVDSIAGAKLARVNMHPIVTLPADPCTPQLGVAGPWFERLPHFKMNFTPSSGEELQSEYFVPREHARAAIKTLEDLREKIGPVLQISEIRTVAADDLWMSPCYKQACVVFHFTWKKDIEGVKRVCPVIEAALKPFKVRPHWGKVFTVSHNDLKEIYVKLPEFQQLLTKYDPEGKFRNQYLNRQIFGKE
jgi:xylitol oxidase